MLMKSNLKREVGSLDILISAISDELTNQPERSAHASTESNLVKEMEEALCELRQARAYRKVLLSVFEKEYDAGEMKNRGH